MISFFVSRNQLRPVQSGDNPTVVLVLQAPRKLHGGRTQFEMRQGVSLGGHFLWIAYKFLYNYSKILDEEKRIALHASIFSIILIGSDVGDVFHAKILSSSLSLSLVAIIKDSNCKRWLTHIHAV